MSLLVADRKRNWNSYKTEKDTLQSALPVIENAEKNTVRPRLWSCQSQMMVASKPKPLHTKTRLLNLTIQQKRPVSDELKTYIDQHGVEETQKALLEAEEKDESIIEARKLAGFKLETKLLSATELQTTTSFDFQVLDVKKASQLEYLKNIGLENLLKNEPSKYISDRLANGATEQ